ncbi:MAG: DUF371 domain-containing protein [Candidatus Woesearchaeota archaeon]|jgi:hypothetical protein|nr:DUF371 domain-containing protein [Candidatus Woesearchaeota archaeon]
MYEFSAFGHSNILSNHKTTIEFTKDKELTLNGDCIVGVRADFELPLLKKFIENKIKNNDKSLKITIKMKNKEEVISAQINPDFDDSEEIVIRKSEFNSKRTLGIRSDKGARDLDRGFVDGLKGNVEMKVSFQ